MAAPRRGDRAAPAGALTVLVIGTHAEAVRRYQLPRRLPRQLALAAALLALALAGTGLHYASLLRVSAVNRQLRGENDALRSRLSAVHEQMTRVSATLDDVERLDARLRERSGQLEPGRSRAEPAARSPEVAPAGAMGPAAPPPPVSSPAGPPRAEADLGAVQEGAERSAGELRAALAYFDDQRALLERVPDVWPARGHVTSDYGTRLDPYSAARAIHRGLDIAARPGDPVLAPSAAKVEFAGVEHGYGNVVVLDHGGGVKTRFGHLSRILVQRGMRVAKGEQVGAVGSTGKSTGPHLHYEVRVNGTAENPRKFLME
ncbi:MAG TPA: M23 family metallopeptidase [Anaeromyxobacteraceae bacterium]|jgi:murein DD-endopeptidase MepM/ murein hydrolase activator NlpD|nr:M23 family metallopeptidase [Anaeromyxobacteraceae bacterium]